MGYTVEGRDLDMDAEGYLLEADLRDETCVVIAEAENIVLTDAHWEVIRHLRDEFQANGHSPNFRALLKGMQARRAEFDSKALYDLFPLGPAKQGAKVAGLPQPYGKAGY
jgi:tRNA 2-thiouridine synthesizing protein E